MGALPYLAIAAVAVWALLRARSSGSSLVAPTPAAEDVAVGLGEQTAGRQQLEAAGLSVGKKYGVLGAIIGWLVAKIAEAFIDPESPDYGGMGLPCSPWLTRWTEGGDAVIRVPDESGVDAVDVTLPAAWLASVFKGNEGMVGVVNSGIVAWVPGANSPIQSALCQVCPWLVAWEHTHLASWYGYTVPGWGHDEFPEAIEWVRLLHAHPFHYKGPHNASELIVACRRLAYFWARDGARFANYLRDLVYEKLDTSDDDQMRRWAGAVQVLADAMHRLGIAWDAPSGDAAKARQRALDAIPLTQQPAAFLIVRDGPSAMTSSYDGEDHFGSHTYRSPAEGFPGAWARP